jgi:predicted RNase H-like HicB family nuclease
MRIKTVINGKEITYKITDEYKPENRPSDIRKVLKLALSYSIRHSSIMHFPEVLEIRKKNDSFIVELNDFEILEIDTNTETYRLLNKDKDSIWFIYKPDWGAVLIKE